VAIDSAFAALVDKFTFSRSNSRYYYVRSSKSFIVFSRCKMQLRALKTVEIRESVPKRKVPQSIKNAVHRFTMD